jgi:hypothetical protein
MESKGHTLQLMDALHCMACISGMTERTTEGSAMHEPLLDLLNCNVNFALHCVFVASVSNTVREEKIRRFGALC